MKRRPKIHYSEADKILMWDRWQKGGSLNDIGRLFDRGHSSIHRILSNNVGVRPLQKRHSRLALTLSEREEIGRIVERKLRQLNDLTHVLRRPVESADC